MKATVQRRSKMKIIYDAVASLEQNERDHHVPTFVSTERKG